MGIIYSILVVLLLPSDDAKAFMEINGGNRTAVSMRTDPIQPTQTQVIKFLPDGFDGGSDGKTFDFDARLAGNDWIVLRYADILLMHAEAILAGGTDTNDPAALASFQKVRDRAGLTEIVTSISMFIHTAPTNSSSMYGDTSGS